MTARIGTWATAILLAFPMGAQAEVTTEAAATPEVVETETTETSPVSTSRDFRGFTPWGVQAQMTTLSLIVPAKLGASVSWNHGGAWTFEAGILNGSLSAGVAGQDVARYTENSYQLTARYFGDRNSFHYIMGLSQETGQFKIGNKYVNYATGFGDIDMAQLQSYAFTLGIGQRWQWGNGISLGIDYASLTIPFAVGDTSSDFFRSSASESDKKQVRDILDFLSKVPRFALFTVNLGYNF